ncbi:hypothetical protein EYF80_004327 [Liparis tanakae]|uniref:Uncharacterized protein n=1 Tax=Liparis tanakae TaxID=230148 RepID=A0A4Z2J4M3_9TELE|nr:hypothetical protein EYF80_004327 [Liparis tanakae]
MTLRDPGVFDDVQAAATRQRDVSEELPLTSWRQFIINGRGFTSGAGSGRQLSFVQPKPAGCSQRLGANGEQQSFPLRWAIMQQHLGKGPSGPAHLKQRIVFLFRGDSTTCRHLKYPQCKGANLG